MARSSVSTVSPSVVCAARHLPSGSLIEEVVRATAEFCGSAEYADDFTVLVLKRLPRA